MHGTSPGTNEILCALLLSPEEGTIRVRIVAIGRLRQGPLYALQAHYAARLNPAPDIVELDLKQRLPPVLAKAREGELILAAIPPAARLVALDEQGALWSSRDFARQMARWREQGVGELAFAIGGADGLDIAVLTRAVARLSLGRMTWPHLLVRGMLLEQLYRAQQIDAGHPYHRD
jgi:23S rRNA (pseudouridine1915-N3)-methyltransferase